MGVPQRTPRPRREARPISQGVVPKPAHARRPSPFEAAFEDAPVGIVITDIEGHPIHANSALLRMVGYSAEEFRRLTSRDVTHPEDLGADVELFSRMLRGELDRYRREKRFFRKDGSLMWATVSASLIRDESGEADFAVGVVEDTTERRLAEEALRRADRALRTLGQCNEALIRAEDEYSLLADVCRTIVDVGGYRLVWVGYAEHDADRRVRPVAQAGFEEGYLDRVRITWADEPLGRGPTGTAIRTGQPAIERDIPEDPAYAPWRDEAMRRGYASSAAFPLLAPAGRCFGALNVYAPEVDAFDDQEMALLSRLADDLAFGVLALRAHADLRKTVDELRRVDHNRRVLLSRLVSAQEDERRRIAADIHDDTIQAMTAVGLRMGSLKSLVGDEPATGKLIEDLGQSVSNAISRLRNLLFELRPPALDHPGGLRACLRQDLERMEEETGMSVELAESVTADISSDSRIVAYRIAQEALANVRKHARASRVEVFVGSQDGGLLVRIKDDGAGFDPAEAAERVPGHLGLTSMRERAELAGGWCHVRSSPGQGTVVGFWLPAEPPERLEPGP
ncbi:MAG: PAS domain S-box protein [Actinomycetota bacterium]